MLGIVICGALVVLMLAAPLCGAVYYYKTKRTDILPINQNKTRDGRYFGKAFAAMIEKNLGNTSGSSILLSRPEEFIDNDTSPEYPETVKKLVIAQMGDFHIPPQVRSFEKEIYAHGSIRPTAAGTLELRAAYSRERIILPENTTVVRWVDCRRTLAVYDGCQLGISASAGQRMCLGLGCRFRRLYAPEIYLGQYPDALMDEKAGKDARIYRMGVQKNQRENIRYISKDMINDEGVVDFTVVSKSNLEILENLIVNGDIRSYGSVRLYDGAVVCGNVFAEKDVHLGRHACVLGNIFSQADVHFEEGAVAGQRTRICSVVARGRITFEKNCFVFGYVDCESGGEILAPEEREEEQPEPAREWQYLPEPPQVQTLRFRDAEDFNNVDQQGFRFFRELRDTVIPMGVERIPHSMFYDCSGLESVELPPTVQEIGDYAFAGCRNLKHISLASLDQLRRIGTSAFEDCVSLERVFLPACLEELGGAAFSGCSGLRQVRFGPGFHLAALPDHCFRGCRALADIDLPPSVEALGVSAFLECPAVPELKNAVEDQTDNAENGT